MGARPLESLSQSLEKGEKALKTEKHWTSVVGGTYNDKADALSDGSHRGMHTEGKVGGFRFIAGPVVGCTPSTSQRCKGGGGVNKKA